MTDWKLITLIVLTVVVFGALMALLFIFTLAGQRALIAALAFILLGFLLSYLSARRSS